MAADSIVPPSDEPDARHRFQFTALNTNNNKWYVYEVWNVTGGLRVIGRYGRVGANKPQAHDYGVISQRQLDQLITERTTPLPKGKGYRPVDLHTPTVVTSQPTATDVTDRSQTQAIAVVNPNVDRLIDLIRTEAGEAIAQYLIGPVDALSQSQIAHGRQLLDSIAQFNKQGSGTIGRPHDYTYLVQEYYNTIPTKLPAKINAQTIVTDFLTADNLSEQEDRLRQLEAALASMTVTKAGGTQAASLGCDLFEVQASSAEYKSIAALIEQAKSASSYGSRTLRVQGIYSVKSPQERAAYLADQRGKSNRQLLFHGTPNKNVRHILRSGLIIPRHASNGRTWGDGIYFADNPHKSANYCRSGISSAPWMMLVSEVSLGKVYETRHIQSYRAAPIGYDSVKGLAGGGYAYNEIVVYTPTQSTVRYLVLVVSR